MSFLGGRKKSVYDYLGVEQSVDLEVVPVFPKPLPPYLIINQ
jgi:hypothetical protein